MAPEKGLRALGIVLKPGGRMIRRASAKRGFHETPGWILESDGSFWEFEPIGRINDWATPISRLIQLVKSEFKTTCPRAISVGEMKSLLKSVRDEFREAPQAADLMRHLGNYPDVEVVSGKMLKEWPI